MRYRFLKINFFIVAEYKLLPVASKPDLCSWGQKVKKKKNLDPHSLSISHTQFPDLGE